MLKAAWNGNKATWQQGKTIEVYDMASGWGARLSEDSTPIQRAFPYLSRQDAMYAAERIAQENWGGPAP